ncbi:MAG: PP-loop domain-containing protein [Chloroflexi bacterium]|nr:PP-loop domain-containing protein [Chloroflexota bacterium]
MSWERRQFYLLKGVNKAIRDYEMIAEGDRIAVALSGGKDSLTLLQLLLARQRTARERYELCAVHVRHEAEECGGPVDLAPLLAYLAQRGVACEVATLESPGVARRERASPCFHCAWRRRKALFQAAVARGCNKVAFGHHADDIAQTTLLNLFFHGKVETMEPRVAFFEDQLTVIRPLAYIREREIAAFALAAGLPVVAQHCAGADRSQRELMGQIIEQVGRVNRKVRINLFRAATRLPVARPRHGGPGEGAPPEEGE